MDVTEDTFYSQTNIVGSIVNQPKSNQNFTTDADKHSQKFNSFVESLESIDHLIVRRKTDACKVATRLVTPNHYKVNGDSGQRFYYGIESASFLNRNFWGKFHPFHMRILDNHGIEVIHLNRSLACYSCYFPCYLQKMQISSLPGVKIGSVEQEWFLFCPSFKVKNEFGDTMLRIKGPCCNICICQNDNFSIISKDGNRIGVISKNCWQIFNLEFQHDLDVQMKAAILGASILIDYMYQGSSLHFFAVAGNQCQ